MDTLSGSPLSNDGPPSLDKASTLSPSVLHLSPAGLLHTRRVGAGIGALGALLIFYGVLLPFANSSNYVPHLSLDGQSPDQPWFLLALLASPVLLLLGVSASTWFGPPPRWLVTLGLVLLLLEFLVLLVSGYFLVTPQCFDYCSAGGHLGSGFWVLLGGFLLGGSGLVVARVSARKRPKVASASQTENTPLNPAASEPRAPAQPVSTSSLGFGWLGFLVGWMPLVLLWLWLFFANRSKFFSYFLITDTYTAVGVNLGVEIYLGTWVTAILVLAFSKNQSMRALAKGTMWGLGICAVLGLCRFGLLVLPFV